MTARVGDLPKVYYANETRQMVDGLIRQIEETAEMAKYWRTAIIAKTVEECQDLYNQLSPEQQSQVQLLTDEEDFMKKSLIIIPTYLAKGLEFDRVFAWNISPENYHTEQDKLILYTVCTRAMHELNLLVIGQRSPLLEMIPETLYRQEALD